MTECSVHADLLGAVARFVGISVSRNLDSTMTFPLLLHESAGEKVCRHPGNVEPVSGFEPLTCRLQEVLSPLGP